MLFKEKLLKILYFISKMYFMLFNFMVDKETNKFLRFMTHVWTIFTIGFLVGYLRILISYMISAEPFPADIVFFVIIGLLSPVIFVLVAKYVVIRFLGRGTFKSPVSSEETTTEEINDKND